MPIRKVVQFSRRRAALVGGLIIAGTIIALASIVSERQARIDHEEAELSDALLSLSRAAGLGGFIHDFKNYILRPTELRYRIEAMRGLDEMDVQIDRIEVLARSRGADYDIETVRGMTDSFRRALADLDDLIGTGMTAREIDKQVRVEERPAQAEIDHMADDIRARLAAAERRAEHARSVLATMFGFLALAAYAALGQRLRRARSRITSSPASD